MTMQKFVFKNKIFKGLALGLAGAMLLTGCGNTIPEMPEEVEKEIGEFAALTLLKYDANHRSRLVDLSVVEAANQKKIEAANKPEPTPTPEKGSSGQSSNTGQSEQQIPVPSRFSSMEEYFGLPEGVNLVYTGYDVSDSYSDGSSAGSYYSLDASEGKKLLVLKFNLINNSASRQDIDVLRRGPVCSITVNGSYTRTSLIPMINNNLSTYEGSLDTGASEEVVLLIEVDNDIAGNIGSVSLSLKDGTDTFIQNIF